jgi:hypothetical protein
MDGIYFDDAQGDDILEVVDLVQRAGDQIVDSTVPTFAPAQFWYVKLTEALAAPTDPDVPTEATGNVWTTKDEDDTLEDSEEEITITNRFVDFSADVGKLITVVLEQGEYIPQGSSSTRKLVMLCQSLSGRAATGQNGGVLGSMSSAAGAVLGPHPTVEGRIVQTGETLTITNVWDISFSAHQVVAVESGLLGFAWTPYGADCGTVGSDESFWNEYDGSMGCE